MSNASTSPSTGSRTRASRGFTLIEVLVVVAIIALLISILLPSLRLARAQAKNTACRGNLHDLGTSFHAYANSQRGFFPVTTWGGEDSFMALWKARMLPNENILLCPATANVIRHETLNRPLTRVQSSAGSMVQTHQPPSDIECVAGDTFFMCKQPGPGGANDAQGGHSYEYQGMYLGRDKDEHHKNVGTFALPPYQSMLVIDADNDWYHNGMGCRGSLSGEGGGNNCPQPWDNHGKEGLNVMYADGHASFEKKVSGIRKYDSNGALGQGSWVKDENLSIDMIWVRSETPYVLKK